MTPIRPAAHRSAGSGDRGFTLIELLVVVIIVGILAAIAIPTFLGQRQRAWERAVMSDLRNIAVAAEVWYSDNGTYAGFDPLLERHTADVELAQVRANGTEYCLDGAHPNLSGGAVIFHLDSRDGTVQPGAC
ncbi:type IV pilin protein [Aquipuribacter sp. SD81]|uniref:type IV pilin protein n=1 Tax=Aquipuribacter sp. SD81 TaxID=3127703 RepID=UPI00301A604F